ncbi:hypothetical protein MPH47_13615 [Psychrobacillus psychrodurans]|uniref:hypothetical protein n=1 Tax=Psychrobacillus psychrodurans TaxID=126157 RepID=UPI001F4EAD2E|nr:hypothetical protein [Psychrobacillus psychrodurans]MCK1998238.1 hypothetical protein [Psychrobacillus psychrodurans]
MSRNRKRFKKAKRILVLLFGCYTVLIFVSIEIAVPISAPIVIQINTKKKLIDAQPSNLKKLMTAIINDIPIRRTLGIQ